MDPARHHAVIAGSGVAGLEALVALRTLAGTRVDITLISPCQEFTLRADAVAAAFGRPAPAQHHVARIAEAHGATYLHDALRVVHREYDMALTQVGRELRYDSLLVAVGANPRPHPALHDALTFCGMRDVPAMAGLLADVDAGRATSVLFVVPPSASWTLPLYELALLCAEHVQERSLACDVTVATHEAVPLGALGHDAGAAIERSLQERGIDLRRRLPIGRLEGGRLLDLRGGVLARADRVVALPLLTGPGLRGLPHDRDGFIPVDEHGAIRGVRGAFAAGDATTIPFKQGGLAAQQGDVAARAIARAAGADVEVGRLHPTLRAHVAAGSGPTWFSAPASATDPTPPVAAREPLWWPPTKVAMPYLADYLQRSGAGIA
jgi:sulfide:quinone oxidoreductase